MSRIGTEWLKSVFKYFLVNANFDVKTVYLDFRDSLSNEDSEIYEDPDTVNFEAPSRLFSSQHVDTSDDEANYEDPSDVDYELPPDSGFKMFTPKGILLYIV